MLPFISRLNRAFDYKIECEPPISLQRRCGCNEPGLVLPFVEHHGYVAMHHAGSSPTDDLRGKIGRTVIVRIGQDEHPANVSTLLRGEPQEASEFLPAIQESIAPHADGRQDLREVPRNSRMISS